MENDYSQYIELAITWGMRIISALAILIAGWVAGNWVKKRVSNF